MKNVVQYCLYGVFAFLIPAFGQTADFSHSVSFLATVISETRVFENPLSGNTADRNIALTLGTGIGLGFGFEKKLQVVFLQTLAFFLLTTGKKIQIPMERCFRMGIPFSAWNPEDPFPCR
jgi:hypothetical protein